jgi:hypothetical protein
MARQVSRQATTSSCCRSWFSARLMTSPRLSLLSVVFSGYARKCITLLVKDHWLVTLRCAFDRSLRSIGVAERRSRRAPGAFWMHFVSSPSTLRTIPGPFWSVLLFYLILTVYLPFYLALLLLQPISISSLPFVLLLFFASVCYTQKAVASAFGSMAMLPCYCSACALAAARVG